MAIEIKSKQKLNGYIESLIGGRSENQDSAGASETELGTIVVVCDGMGGLQGGSTASKLAVQTIIDDIAKEGKDMNAAKALELAIIHANKVIIDEGSKDPDLMGMGTTVTAAIINKECITVAHVGDSRIYQLRGKEKVFRTNDHSQVFQLVLNGAISEEQARTSPNSNVILKALGVSEKVEPEIAILPYNNGDRFVMCTDGFWGARPESDIINLITAKGKLEVVLQNACADIDNLGKATGGQHDNLSVAVFDMECDSKMKSNMRKRMKIFIASLIALLIASVVCNLVMCGKCSKLENKKPSAEAVSDSLPKK